MTLILDVLTEINIGSDLIRVENFDPDTVKGDVNRRTAQRPHNQRDKPLIGPLWSEFKFRTDWAASGVAGTKSVLDALYLAAGLHYETSAGVSTTYSVTGDHATDLTRANLYAALGDETKYSCLNCVTGMTINLEAGAIPTIDWEAFGQYAAPTDAALGNALGTIAEPEVCVNMTLTVGTDDLDPETLTIKLGNENDSPRKSLTEATGVAQPNLTGQTPTWDVVCPFPDLATANYYTDLAAATKTTLAVVLSGGAGNILTLGADGYLASVPKLSVVNGLFMVALEYEMGWGSGDTFLNWVET